MAKVGFNNGVFTALQFTVDPQAVADGVVQYSQSGVDKWRHGNDITDVSWRLSEGSALGTNDSIIARAGGLINLPRQAVFQAFFAGNVPDVTGNGATYIPAFDQVQQQGTAFTTGVGATFTAPVNGFYLFCWTLALTDLTIAMTDMLLQLNHSGVAAQVLRQNPFPNYVAANTSWSGAAIVQMTASSTCNLVLTISGGAGNTVDLIGTGIGTTFSGSLLC